MRGQRQWYKDLDLRIGLALVAINGVPLLLGTTPEHAQSLGGRWAVVSGGRTKKETAANRIAKATGLSVDDILGVARPNRRGGGPPPLQRLETRQCAVGRRILTSRHAGNRGQCIRAIALAKVFANRLQSHVITVEGGWVV